MNRRNFLKYALYTTLLASGTAGLGLRAGKVMAQTSGIPYGRTLIHVMLLGGADLRYLFVPDPGFAPEYAAKFWEARSSIYQYNAANAALYSDYETVWTNLYTPVTDQATGYSLGFGIHKSAAWLKAQFDAGNVAIVANVLGSDNRRHDHSQLIVHTGDLQASQYVYGREGWGGRLIYAIADANAVAVTNDISVFCNGIDPGNRNAHVVHAKDTRNFGLSPGDGDPTSDNSVMARALKAYYAQKQLEAAARPAEWSYRRFLQHEHALRTFGDAFNARLAEVAPAQPAALAVLYAAGSGNTLNSANSGQQCANAYDSFLGANEDIVYLFSTDFGRQLRANGDWGTDHGRGNYSILVGRGVNGGPYGEMFPISEIQGAAGDTRFDQQGADIEGRTSFERVLAEVCDWVEPDTGDAVVPGAATSMSETGDALGLFA